MAKKPSKSKTSASLNKSQQIVGMLKRVNGASIPELVKATDWQAHSIRGFLSGHVMELGFAKNRLSVQTRLRNRSRCSSTGSRLGDD